MPLSPEIIISNQNIKEYIAKEANDEHVSTPTFFSQGDVVSLAGTSCDGFSMREQQYEIIKSIDTFADIPINSFIVKQLTPSQDLIYTLSKSDCRFLDIEYQPGLQLFPQSMNWKHVQKANNFENDALLSNYKIYHDKRGYYIIVGICAQDIMGDKYFLFENTRSEKIAIDMKTFHGLALLYNPRIMSEPTQWRSYRPIQTFVMCYDENKINEDKKICAKIYCDNFMLEMLVKKKYSTSHARITDFIKIYYDENECTNITEFQRNESRRHRENMLNNRENDCYWQRYFEGMGKIVNQKYGYYLFKPYDER